MTVPFTTRIIHCEYDIFAKCYKMLVTDDGAIKSVKTTISEIKAYIDAGYTVSIGDWFIDNKGVYIPQVIRTLGQPYHARYIPKSEHRTVKQ